ncbi:hypothetical protein BX666DRAFT_1824976, partial [Dichotomocladium elegans]
NYNVHTNNYIESWHRLLKDGYLGKMAGQRVDVLLYILWDMVLPDFKTDHVRCQYQFQTVHRNQADRQ